MSYWRAEDSLDWEDDVLAELARKNKTTKSDMLERLERRTFPLWIKVFALVVLGLVVYGCIGAEKYFMGSVYLQKCRQADGLIDKIKYVEKGLHNTPGSWAIIVEEMRLLRYLSRDEDGKFIALGVPMTTGQRNSIMSMSSGFASLQLAPTTLDEMVLANWMMDNMINESRRTGS